MSAAIQNELERLQKRVADLLTLNASLQQQLAEQQRTIDAHVAYADILRDRIIKEVEL